jgi:hypothetical protein
MGASTAAIIGGVAAGAGSMAGGLFGASGAEQAASTAASAQEYATNTQYKMFEEALNLQMPQIKQGQTAMGLQDYLLGIGKMPSGVDAGALKAGGYSEGSLLKPFTAEQMYQDPGYQFRLKTSEDSLKSAAAASGTYGSGTMAASLQNLAGNLASSEYGAAYGRYMEPFSLLGGMSGLGANASSQAASLSQATGGQMASTIMEGGQLQAGYENLAMNMLGRSVTGGSNLLAGGLANYAGVTGTQGLLGNLLSGMFGGQGSLTTLGNPDAYTLPGTTNTMPFTMPSAGSIFDY